MSEKPKGAQTPETPPAGARPEGKPFHIGKIRVEHWQLISLLIMLYDFLAVTGSYFMALWVRFDGVYSAIPETYKYAYGRFAPWFALVTLVIFFAFRMYNIIWRYASFSALIRSVLGSLTSSFLHALGISLLIRRMPIAYYVLGGIFQMVLVVGIRFAYRTMQVVRFRMLNRRTSGDVSRVMLVQNIFG